MTRDAAAAAAVAACQAKRDARALEHDAIRRLHDAIRGLYAAGVPQRQIPGVVRAALLEDGWTEAEVDGVGVSYASVRLAMRGQ